MNENTALIAKAHAKAMAQTQRILSAYGGAEIPSFLAALFSAREIELSKGDKRSMIGSVDITDDLVKFERGPMARANAVARAFRKAPRTMKEFPTYAELMKGAPELMKASPMDVGVQTNLAQVVGGQSLGYVSMDTNMARGTIRPGSFTLYQMLKKTRANQVVDYWPYASETGGPLPGAAYNSYSSVSSGSLVTSAGSYNINAITLKLAYDGRAITTALAAQNSFVDVTGQENANAALTVLSSVDWALYWGNPDMYPSQPIGLYETIKASAPSKNMIDFQVYKTASASLGLTDEQLLFNLIFEQAAQMVGYRTYGIPTHAVMAPGTAGDFQRLPTAILQQIVNTDRAFADHGPMVINGNLQGMNTRFGDIHFPVDLLMTARDIPAQAIVFEDDSTPTLPTSVLSGPATVTVAPSGSGLANSDWTADYCAASGIYMYAVASTDSEMNESVLTYNTAEVSGVSLLGSYVVTIAQPSTGTAHAFRVYRSGKDYNNTSTPAPGDFRFVGEVLAAGTGNTTFTDLNNHIPGSETIFILDLDEVDDAFDYRWLLPLSKIELFAQNLFMPWAVAHIGAPRVRIPKFHGFITNYVPQKTDFNPLQANNL